MKKILAMSLMAAGMVVSLNASAAPANIVVGTPVSRTADCLLLAEDVNLNLSNNVHGAYNCDVPNAAIRVATCHLAGSRKAATIQCAQVGTLPDGTAQYNNASCTSTADTFQLANFRAFFATSTGGTVGTVDLGAGAVCDDATIKGLSLLGQ